MTEEMYRKYLAIEQELRIHSIENKVAEIRKQRTRERLNQQLKPCAFCGGKAYIHNDEMYEDHEYYETVCVECKECGARSIRKICDGYCCDEEIAALWNQRV